MLNVAPPGVFQGYKSKMVSASRTGHTPKPRSIPTLSGQSTTETVPRNVHGVDGSCHERVCNLVIAGASIRARRQMWTIFLSPVYSEEVQHGFPRGCCVQANQQNLIRTRGKRACVLCDAVTTGGSVQNRDNSGIRKTCTPRRGMHPRMRCA